MGAELEEVEGLLDKLLMDVIVSGENPPFGIVAFPESLDDEEVWILIVGFLDDEEVWLLIVGFLDDI